MEVSALFAHLLALALPLSIIQIFDRVIPDQGYATLGVLFAFLVAAAVGEVTLRAASVIIASRKAAEFEIEASDRLTFLTLYEQRRASEAHDPDTVFEHFETIDRLSRQSVSDARHARFTLPFVAAFGTAFAVIAPGLLWVLLLALSLVIAAQIGIGRTANINEQMTDRSMRNAAFINEAFDSLETIKSMHAEPALARRYEVLALGTAHIREKAALAKGRRRALTETVASAVPVSMAIFGCVAVLSGQMTAGALASAILLSGRIIQPLMRAQSAREARFAIRPSKRALEARLAQQMPSLDSFTPGRLEKINVKNLTVCGSDGQELLNNVSFDISAGETIAISGNTGSGKSLLLRALNGRLKPDMGAVYWNGSDVQDCNRDALGARMQLLSSATIHPAETALELMTGGDPSRTLEVLNICAQLGMQQSFAEHPIGMDAKLGEASVQLLPASVLRRLHIVRAFAMRPDVILFDEANAGLDAEADTLLRQYLADHKGEFALVMVSSRPSYLSLADRHFEMKAGVLSSGTKDLQPHGMEAAR